MVAVATAFTGVIGFVGLIVPHILRMHPRRRQPLSSSPASAAARRDAAQPGRPHRARRRSGPPSCRSASSRRSSACRCSCGCCGGGGTSSDHAGMIEADGVDVSRRRPRRSSTDVSAAFEPGRLHLIIGPNGAGKSTLVKLLARLLAPESGGVRYDGADARALASAIWRGAARCCRRRSRSPSPSACAKS